MKSTRSLGVVGLLLAGLAVPAQAKTLIHAGRLIDGTGDTVRTAVTVTVDGDRITGVANGFAAAGPGDVVIDLRTATLMPGWIDLHVHVTGEQSGRPAMPNASS